MSTNKLIRTYVNVYSVRALNTEKSPGRQEYTQSRAITTRFFPIDVLFVFTDCHRNVFHIDIVCFVHREIAIDCTR
jgi:hypothetical protein